jgi:hypothetical protein
MIVLARTFAVAELCRYELRAYQGIWALAWRALAVLAVFFLANATIDAWGQLNRIAIYELTIERDVEISSILILIVMLLVLKYYGLPLEPLHRWIALGICLVSIIDVMNNTVLHNAFAGALSSWFHTASASSWSGLKSQVESANDLWNLIHICGLMAAMSIWSFGLRKALPATAQAPVLLPADVYRDLSPAVNLRLRAFNDRLLEMLKP